MRRLVLLAGSILLVAASAAPASAQQAVSATPRTYVTRNNKTQANVYRQAIAYFGDSNSYVPAETVEQSPNGVPNNLFSYVVTQGNNGGRNGFISSIAFTPAMGATPARYDFPTTPAGRPNTSLGGLIDAFNWGSADVIMDQCFGGGFAFNIAGSLQGATPRGGGAMVAPVNRIGYTFASGANYNEYSFGVTLPRGSVGTRAVTAVGDFTQGQAYGETPPGPFTMYNAYVNGRVADPFVVGGDPYGLMNQTPANLQSGGFESPVYGSSDAPGPDGAPSTAAAAVNNNRTYMMGAANKWAVLVAFTPNRNDFTVDVEREYFALIQSGVPAGHIAVLFGTMGGGSTLPSFPSIAAANNRPRLPANFTVPVQGEASNEFVAGLLNPNLIQNPGAPAAMQVDYWQYLFGTGHDGARPAVGNSLVLFTTGHGSAVNVFGAELAAANRPVGGGVFQTDFKIDGPSNIQIIPGGTIEAQITVRGMPLGLAADNFSVDGVSVGPGVLTDPSGTVLDMSRYLGNGLGQGLTYLDITIPDSLLTPGGGGSVFDLSISNTNDLSVAEFQNDFDSFTWMDDTVANCETGACDLYTDLIGVPEPATWTLLIGGVGVTGAALRRRQSAVRRRIIGA